MASEEEQSLDELRTVIRTCPVIDNHAHNLLRPSKLRTCEFLTSTTEATGDALEDTPRSLSHLRAVRQLRELYGCDRNAGWGELMRKRQALLHEDPDALIRKCLEGTHTILMDDGINDDQTVHPFHWHDQFTVGPTKRIVRIETVAANIMRDLHEKGALPTGDAISEYEDCSEAWVVFLGAFESAIADEIRDDHVCGFKSVICYRTGLHIRLDLEVEVAANGLDAFQKSYLPDCVSRNFRIDDKGMNDCLVISVCKLLASGYREYGIAKPIQFHTGLGDNDINLIHANPAYMQSLIKQFPTVQFVLLHSSYPYTREAGYLATVYKNAYLDIGEVFPMVGRDGQMAILREAFELTPISKILWSTDGHHFPETYWLGNKQFRECLETLLVDYVKKGDLTVKEAIDAARDIMFYNSKTLYNLHVSLENAPSPKVSLRITDKENDNNGTLQTQVYDHKALEAFKEQHPVLKFVYIQWLDYMATMRTRIVTMQEFTRLVMEGERIGISRGNTGTLQNDHTTPAVDTTGQIYVEPDLATLRISHPRDSLRAATVIGSFRDEDGKPLPSCPRSSLQTIVSRFSRDHDINFLIGFEIEITFLRRTSLNSFPYEPLDTNHAWASLTPDQFTTVLPILGEIVDALLSVGITIQQFHSEAGAGQYEFILPPLPALQAVDTLVQARQVIQQIAATHGLRATLHPMPIEGIGTAAHAHISLNSPTLTPEQLEQKELSFFASALAHLPALCAFMLPERVSYKRVADDSWMGGTWVAWGTQNRETPLRRVRKARWEIRCLDGVANMYLAMAALLGAGLVGVEERVEMVMRDCERNPSRLTEEERKGYGIVTRLPRTIEESLTALEEDAVLEKVLSPGITEDYVAMKREEQKMLDEMPEDERRIWLIERY